MCFRIICLLFVFHSSSLFSQISDSEMAALKAKWRVDLRSKGHELAMKYSVEEGASEFSDSIQRSFLEDTFVVENLLIRQLQKEPTTLGINKANLACASEYEKLVDNYYAVLLSKMKEEDKELVISWHRARRSLLEEERRLIGKLMQEEYSGGGSIQSITYTQRLMKAQKDHLLALVDFLTHLI